MDAHIRRCTVASTGHVAETKLLRCENEKMNMTETERKTKNQECDHMHEDEQNDGVTDKLRYLYLSWSYTL